MSRLRRRTWILIGSVVVVLTAAAIVVFGFVLPATNAQSRTIETTATASLETLEQKVSGSGTLSPLVDPLQIAAAGDYPIEGDEE